MADETLTENESLGPGISGNAFLEERPIPGLLCLSRGCEHLRFSSEVSISFIDCVLKHPILPYCKFS